MGNMIQKYKAVILYLIFGVLTTCVNVVIYWLAAHEWRMPTLLSTVIAWIVAVLFAYLTNRKWVFESRAFEKSAIIREIISFFMCRFVTGIMDLGCMFLFVDIMQFNDVITKFVSNVLVIILNYIASKLIIFKRNFER